MNFSLSLSSLQTSLTALIKSSFAFFLVTAVLVSILWLGGDSILLVLNYSREGILQGEYWRLLSGHFIHSNGWHLLLNLASLMMIGLLFAQHLSNLLWTVTFTVSGLIISGCYFWLAPEYQHYVGLSAILYAVIIIGALLDIKQQPKIAWLILTVVTFRVIWQQFYGSMDSLSELIEDRVAIESHLFGICTGYCLGFLLLIHQKFSLDS